MSKGYVSPGLLGISGWIIFLWSLCDDYTSHTSKAHKRNDIIKHV